MLLNVTIEEFQNFATAGTLSLVVKSVTSLPAEFELRAACSQLISAIPSKTMTLEGREIR